jgi:exodeoxyribonuclease VII large subunit
LAAGAQPGLFDGAAAEAVVAAKVPVSNGANVKKVAAGRGPSSRPYASTLPAWAAASMPAAATKPARVMQEREAVEESFEDEPPVRHIWRVADLVGDVRSHIEDAYADLWVRGEISNLRAAPSGHMYFTLKDGDAQLPAVLFRRQAQALRFRPEDGLEVLLRGRVSVYEQRGQMQLIAEYLEPVGAGSLQLAFEQLKRKLEAEGMFAMDRKQLLPSYPRCVGIVTSPSGAVIRDFMNVANRRHASLDILLYPAVVQGAAAAAEIAAGIAYFNQSNAVDVIVIARGGGSLEDLAPFNSEVVARAIATSRIPVVSAVGHETDFTIADFVADLRAPTPSAAAEIITTAQHRIEDQLTAFGERLARAVRYSLLQSHRRFANASMDAEVARMRSTLGRREQRVDEMVFRLERAVQLGLRKANMQSQSLHSALMRQEASQRLGLVRERLAALQLRLGQRSTSLFASASQRYLDARARLNHQAPLDHVSAQSLRVETLTNRLQHGIAARQQAAVQMHASASRALSTLSPLAVLGRGYSLVFAADGHILTRAAQTEPGEAIRIRLADGSITATVTEDN